MTRAMNFDVTANDSASREFAQIAAAAERLENQLQRLDRLRVEPTAQLNITPATRAAAQLQSRLEALRNVRASVVVDGAAEARRDVTALVVEMRKLRNARVRIDIDGDGRAQVAALVTQLRTLARNVTVNVALGDGTFARDIARLHQRISALSGARVRIHIEVTPPGIREELNGIADALRRIRDTRARITADTSGASASVKSLSDALGKLGKGSAVAISIPGLISTTGQVASLGASVVQLTGVLGLVPAAGFAAGAGIAALAVGLNGLGDALGPTGTAAEIEKVNEAMARLSPAARELVTQVRGLGPAWSDVRLDVQERLLAGLGETVQRVGGTYMPTLRAGLGGIATELNVGAKGFADWVTSGRTVNDVNTILGNTRETFRELAPAGVNVAAALTDIGVVGSGIMPELAAGATRATGSFREFIAEARQTGQLEQWIRGGISTMEQLGRITINTGSIFGAVFSASEEAGYGFLDTVEDVTQAVDELLSSAEGRSALVELFREAGQTSSAAAPGVRELGGAALTTVGAFAKSDGLERFGGLVSQVASGLSPLVAQLGAVAGDGLGALASGASLAVSALAPLVGGAAAVVDGLGPIPGLVLAGVVAFKTLGLATASVTALGASIAATAALTGTLTAGLTGSLAAGAAAQAGMTRLGGAVTALGRNLPLIGVGLVAAGFLIDQFTADFDGAVQKVTSGSQSMSAAIAEQAAIIDSNQIAWLGGLDAAGSYAVAQEEVTRRVIEAEAAMGPLERAQSQANRAQTAYNDALRDNLPNSSAVRDAAAALAVATDRVEQEQWQAAQNAREYNDVLRDQVSAAQSALGANIQLEDALARVAEAQRAANEAAAEYGVGSEEAAAANREFVSAADQAAQSARSVAEGLAASLGPQAAADAGAAAYGATLLQTAATASGPARDAMLGYLATLSQAELDSLSAGAAALGFNTQILQLPDGKTVTIAVDPETGEIVSTQGLLDGLRDGNVAINLETAAALAGLESFIGIVNGAAGTVTIDGNPQAAGTALLGVLDAIAAGEASVNINGQTVPAQQALNTIIGQIADSGAEVSIGGQNLPASQVLGATLTAIRQGRENVTIGGESYPAQAVLNAIVGSVSRSNPQLTILGRDGGVAALKAKLSAPSSSTHTIRVLQTGAVPGKGYHDGGIAPAQRFHDGGVAVARMAMGGQIPRPFTAGRAQVFPPRLLRITGDRTDVDEFYIPDNAAGRSMSLGREWARRRGMDLVPRGRQTAGAGGPRGAVAQQMQAAITQVRVQSPGAPSVDVGSIVRELGALRAELRDRVGTTVNQTLVTADPAEAGRQSALAIRTGI